MLATGQLVMNVGTVLDGKADVKEGLIDSLVHFRMHSISCAT